MRTWVRARQKAQTRASWRHPWGSSRLLACKKVNQGPAQHAHSCLTWDCSVIGVGVCDPDRSPNCPPFKMCRFPSRGTWCGSDFGICML